MNYQLSSLHLSTTYDDPIEPLVVPGNATRGAESNVLTVLDGANRAPNRLARLVRRVGLLGLRVANPARGVRVTVCLIADDMSLEMWGHSHLDEDGKPLLSHDHACHRLVEISAQGRTRAVAMIVRKPGEEKSIVEVTFDVPGEEIGDSGRLMLGFEQPADCPPWAEAGLMPDGVVGLCVRNVKLALIPDKPSPWFVSGGRSPRSEPGVTLTRPGFFMVNPGGEPGPVELTLAPQEAPRRPAPQGRRAKLKEPALRVRDAQKGARAAMLARREVEVEVVSFSGQPLLQERIRPESAALRVRLPETAEPCYARARVVPRRGRSPKAIDWSVGLAPVGTDGQGRPTE